MPRIDNIHSEIRELFELGEFNQEDPLDVCMSCYHWTGLEDDVEHPPYDEQDPPYVCAWCGCDLDGLDD